MGFYKEDYAILHNLQSDGLLGKEFSVCEFGAQDLLEDEFGNVIHQYKEIKENNSVRGFLERTSARVAYEKFGAKNYECIDLEKAHNAHNFDLGLPLDTEYGYKKQFDLISCKDVGHWVFNQDQMFRNLHNLVKRGGVIIWRSSIGGTAHGWFAYHHYKILQLCFANNYLFKGGFITEIMHQTTSGKFANFDRKEAVQLPIKNAYGWFEAVEEYIGRADCWRYSAPMSAGLPSIVPTLIFVKTTDEPFKTPLFYYAPPQETIKRNAKAVLVNCFPPTPKAKVAIFGAGVAGELAAIFAKEAGLEVLCFIDDYKSGKYLNKDVMSGDDFEKRGLAKEIDFLLLGPNQHGKVGSWSGDLIVRSLDLRWFVG